MAFNLTVKEAAAQLGVSPARVYQLIDMGKLAAEKIGTQWLVDAVGVKERKAAHPSAGRPSARSEAKACEYVLMSREHEVLRFEYDESSDAFLGVSSIVDGERAPLGIVSPRGAKGSVEAFALWWRNRSIPMSRHDIEMKLAQLGLSETSQIPFTSWGLSLSDQYWVKPVSSDASWGDINFFDNPFPDMDVSVESEDWDWLADVGLQSPDNTSDGELSKRWACRAGQPVLLKGAGALGQEPYNEAVATELYSRLLEPGEFVPYELLHGSAGAMSCCADFLSSTEEFIPAFYVRQIKRKPNHFNEYQHYVDCCAALGIEDAALALDKMLVCDDILANFDRHWRNFGIVRDVETLACRVAPIFDSGSSLWCNQSLRALRMGRPKFSTKPFHEDANRQLALVNDYSWLDTDALTGFADAACEILAGDSEIADRLDVIRDGIQWRIDRILMLL